MGCRASDVVMWTIEVDEKRDWGKKREQRGHGGFKREKQKARERSPASHSHALGGSGGPSPVKRSPERQSSQSRESSCSRTVPKTVHHDHCWCASPTGPMTGIRDHQHHPRRIRVSLCGQQPLYCVSTILFCSGLASPATRGPILISTSRSLEATSPFGWDEFPAIRRHDSSHRTLQPNVKLVSHNPAGPPCCCPQFGGSCGCCTSSSTEKNNSRQSVGVHLRVLTGDQSHPSCSTHAAGGSEKGETVAAGTTPSRDTVHTRRIGNGSSTTTTCAPFPTELLECPPHWFGRWCFFLMFAEHRHRLWHNASAVPAEARCFLCSRPCDKSIMCANLPCSCVSVAVPAAAASAVLLFFCVQHDGESHQRALDSAKVWFAHPFGRDASDCGALGNNTQQAAPKSYRRSRSSYLMSY
ncbi:hypothetical protein B0T21DRAFT_436058 [Apiosordaria backusii]|uniref:Uncharacterized protein n=1 Tax=Apiosordaria backusii TaxID=314023 RepID=A0AA40EIQ2_9PEZI|nr:hypothetical protein B0T21DRAFT_436058 [Apiosordaria backusii]